MSLIPDHDWLGVLRTGYFAAPFFMVEMGGNYQYLHDNLLDTTHLTYLHAGVLDGGEMAGAKYWSKEEGQILSLGRDIPGMTFDDYVAKFFRVEAGRPYDRSLVTETFVPSISIAKQSLQPSEHQAAAPVEFYAINALTPASATHTCVFHAYVTSYDPSWQPADIDRARLILNQDKVAVEPCSSATWRVVMKRSAVSEQKDLQIYLRTTMSGEILTCALR